MNYGRGRRGADMSERRVAPRHCLLQLPQPNDPNMQPGMLMAVHLLRVHADAVDKHYGSRWLRWVGSRCLSPKSMRRTAAWLEDFVESPSNTDAIRSQEITRG